MKSLVLNIDLDNVVYDFYGTFALWLRENNYFPIPRGPRYHWSDGYTYDWPEPTQWEFWNDWGMSYGEWNNWFRRGVEYGYIWHTGRAIPGAVDTLWRLSDGGHYIRLVTHRLVHKFGHRIAVGATADWLDRNNIPYRDLVFMSQKQDLSGDVMIDDNQNHILNAAEKGIPAYLLLTSANEKWFNSHDYQPCYAVSNWQEFYEVVTERSWWARSAE